jgi:hypothetical protein
LRNNYTAREGGGLWTSAVSAATITDSAIVNNQAYEYGGGIQVNSVMTVTNTTISGNYAVTGSGGGISEWNNAKLWLFNVTIASNWTNGPSTWAMYNPRATYAVNTIIASAPGKAACSHGVYQDTNNLGADNTCGISTQAPNLRLGALADWGGDTYTHILLPGSPAIDGGDNASCPAVDQRGVPRPYDGNYDGVAVCDIGALEWAAKSIYLPMVRR